MLLLLFFLSVWSEPCRSQYAAYSGLLPYEPPTYALRRPPPQRRSAIEALERLRLPPVARYFPQVDTPLSSAPYPLMENAEGGLYALPPQWAEEFAQPVEMEEPEYANYEYDPYNAAAAAYRPQQAPAYAEEVYPQVDPESAEYNDLMESYLMGAPPQQQQQLPLVQRRSEETKRADLVPNTSDTPDNYPPQPTALPTPQVQMTAVPASPAKKNVKSLVVPDPAAPSPSAVGGASSSGQKEEPLFRPLQSSQRTTWSEGGAPTASLSRAKNARDAPNHKTPIPLLKQMIQIGREVKSEEDPLMQELSSLKKSL